MSITAIKYVQNQSSLPVEIVNDESHETSNGSIPPGEGRSMNTWVPWCGSQSDFNNGHRITVRLRRPGQEDTMFAIWQQGRRDGDYVRFTQSAEEVVFDGNAPPIWTGNDGARAGGDRILYVQDGAVVLNVLGVSPSFMADTSERSAAYFRAMEEPAGPAG